MKNNIRTQMTRQLEIVRKDDPIRVAVVNMENAVVSSILGIQDLFYFTNNFFLKQMSHHQFEVEVVHIDSNIQNYNAPVSIKSQAINKSEYFDIVIIPPMIIDNSTINVPIQLHDWLNNIYVQGGIICSVCVGAYVLAQTGLLDNKKATTHWIIESKFLEDFPKVQLDVNKIIIEDKNIITTGGIYTYVDLVLYIIAKFVSIEMAQICANFLVVDASRTSQQHYKDLSLTHYFHDDELKKLLVWIDFNYHHPFSIADLAKRINITTQTLVRKFIQETGETPNKYLQKKRVEKAKELLTNSKNSFDEITALVGYEDVSSFRRLFKKVTGYTPSTYKKLFLSTNGI